jgi:hypothetical protein
MKDEIFDIGSEGILCRGFAANLTLYRLDYNSLHHPAIRCLSTFAALVRELFDGDGPNTVVETTGHS